MKIARTGSFFGIGIQDKKAEFREVFGLGANPSFPAVALRSYVDC